MLVSVSEGLFRKMQTDRNINFITVYKIFFNYVANRIAKVAMAIKFVF